MLYELLVRPAACQRLYVMCASGVLPRVLCCYRTDHVVLLPCHRGHYLYCWYDIIFLFVFSEVLQHTRYKGSAHTAVEEATQRVLSGSSDWEGGRVMRRQKATISNNQDGGESSSLSFNSEGETCFAETVSSVSAEPPPCEDTSTTSSDSRERCYR